MLITSRSRLFISLVLTLVSVASTVKSSAIAMPHVDRWTSKRAWRWYRHQPWLVGCNYIPASAENTIQMWQGATFDPGGINRELGWAQRLGFNTIRVFLDVLVWNHHPHRMEGRMKKFLIIARQHKIKVMFVLFDDCWKPTAHLGPQPAPIPGVHNSQWVQCPGPAMIRNLADWPELKDYEQGVIRAFKSNPQILCWDLYNEAGNSGNSLHTLPLLKKVFVWARECHSRQPLTACIYQGQTPQIARFVLAHSDVITFHNYSGPKALRREIQTLQKLDRPFFCTEYMRRPVSTFAKCMPIFKATDVGCLNWGLTNGKTQTIYPWWSKPGSPPPKLWFHNILHRDGRPFSIREVHLIEHFTGAPLWPR